MVLQALLTAALVCALAPAYAGTFTVAPVRMYLGPKDRALAVTITNAGETELVLQADLFEWTQNAEGRDQLVPTEDLILAPPIIKIPPRGRQVVRLAMVAPRDASRQLTYRMIMREVPEAVPAAASGVSVQIALAMNMPVFVSPVGAKRKVECELLRKSEQPGARCANLGTAYAQVRELRLMREGQVLAKFEGGSYILPGARRVIDLQAEQAVSPGAAKLAVRFDDGTETTMDLLLP